MSTKAKNSASVKQIKKKVQKRLAHQNAQINPAALEVASQAVLRQLENAKPRKSTLGKKHFSLFDENKHSAPIKNKFVLRLFSQLHKPNTQSYRLKGRVSYSL